MSTKSRAMLDWFLSCWKLSVLRPSITEGAGFLLGRFESEFAKSLPHLRKRQISLVLFDFAHLVANVRS